MQEQSMWAPQVVSVIPRTALGQLLQCPQTSAQQDTAKVPSALLAEAQDRAEDFPGVIFACLRCAGSL